MCRAAVCCVLDGGHAPVGNGQWRRRRRRRKLRTSRTSPGLTSLTSHHPSPLGTQALSKGPPAAASPTAKRRSSVVTFDGANLSVSALSAAGPHPPGMGRAASFNRTRSYRERESATNVGFGMPNSVLAAAMFTAAATGGGGPASLLPGSGRSFTGPGMAAEATGAPTFGRSTSMRRGSVTEVGAVSAGPHPLPLASSTSMHRREVEFGQASGLAQQPHQPQQQLQHMASGSAARRASLVAHPVVGAAPQSCSQVGYLGEGELARVASGGFEGVLGAAHLGGSFSQGGMALSPPKHAAMAVAAQHAGGGGGGGRLMQMLKGMFTGGSSSHDGAEPASAPQPHVVAVGGVQQLAHGGVGRQRGDSVSFSATRSGLSFVGRSAQSVTSVPFVSGAPASRAPSSSQHTFTAAAAAAGMAAVSSSGMSFSGQQQFVGGVGSGVGVGLVGSGPSFSGGGRGQALVPTVSNNNRRASSTSFRATSSSQIPHVLQQSPEGVTAGGSLPVLSRTRSVKVAAAAAAALSALAH